MKRLYLVLILIFISNISYSQTFNIIAQKDLPQNLYDIHVEGNYMFVIGDNYTIGDAFLNVYDVTNFNNPIEMSTQSYSSYSFGRMVYDNNKIYVVGSSGLHIFDVSTPTAPVLEASHAQINSYSIGDYDNLVAKSGNLLFVNSSIDRFICMDITNPSAPVFKDDVYFNWDYTIDFHVTSSTTGMLNDGSGLRPINFSDPNNLQVALSTDPNYINLPGDVESTLFDAAQNYCYADVYSWGDSWFFSVDLTNKTIADSIQTASDLDKITLQEDSNWAAVGTSNSFYVFDISNPSNLQLLLEENSGGEDQIEFYNEYLIAQGGIGVEDMVIYGAGGASSVSELLNVVNLKLYPNPGSDVLIVSGLNKISGLENMEITSPKGEVVMKINGTNEEVNISLLPAGVYFLNINHEQGVETLRFVKE